MIGEPFVTAPVQLSSTEVPSEYPLGLPGASGAADGVMLDEAGEYEPVPCSEIAKTRNT